ncbi:MAG: KR domain-containing protein, partial [Bacteroidetes bacterium]
MTILLTGGYGHAGRLLARLLWQARPDLDLILAGRDAARAETYAAELAALPGPGRVRGLGLDLSHEQHLRQVLQDVDLLVVASSTLAYTRIVAQAALDTDTDYLDVLLSTSDKHSILRELAPEIQARGRTFITDGG